MSVLENIPGDHFPENLASLLFEQLKVFRNEWSEEIPEEILNSAEGKDGDRRYKVRKGWFTNVGLALENLKDMGELTTEAQRDAVQEFIDNFSGAEEFKGKARVTAADIKKANELIDIILQEQN